MEKNTLLVINVEWVARRDERVDRGHASRTPAVLGKSLAGGGDVRLFLRPRILLSVSL